MTPRLTNDIDRLITKAYRKRLTRAALATLAKQVRNAVVTVEECGIYDRLTKWKFHGTRMAELNSEMVVLFFVSDIGNFASYTPEQLLSLAQSRELAYAKTTT